MLNCLRFRQLQLCTLQSPTSKLCKSYTTRPTMGSSKKLQALRSQFDDHGIGMYVVLTQDEHDSEYTSLADNRREFISGEYMRNPHFPSTNLFVGFTGSAGTVVISKTKAVLATDGRYFLQADKQLDKNWKVLKQGVPGVPTWQQWVAQQVVQTGAKVGIDSKLISYTEYDSLVSELQKHEALDSLVSVKPNLVDQVWGEDQPKQSEAPVKIHPLEFTGRSFEAKLTELRTYIAAKGGEGFLVSALDEVAWLYNLRGDDVKFNPVFRAFSYITANKAVLYIDKSKLSKEIIDYLGDKVQIKSYDDVLADCAQIKESLLVTNASAYSPEDRKKILVSSATSWAHFDALGGSKFVSVIASPVNLAKSVKNSTEIKGCFNSHVKDGVALTRYFAWLENELQNGNTTISDYNAGVKSKEFRSKMEGYKGLSFETISSSGPNAAVIHYAPATDSKFMVDINQVYLCDSGAQYLDGTTDTTRTIHFGTPKAKEIAAYTNVLKGHIALAKVVFPEGVNGYMLDAIARQFLWQQGLDYRHGTGHGVGSYLNVHEGPMGIGIRLNYTTSPLQIGNVISNEPGYYEDGAFGIRIENMVVVKEVKTKHNFGGKKFLGFDTVTRVPYCRKLIDIDLLMPAEIEWVDAYHQIVRDTISPFLAGDQLSKDWLIRETAKL